jgi:8-oxo-dGTP pyrophosphatase MutT (NUDIX family)
MEGNTEFPSFVQFLRDRLRAPLPGYEGQRAMAPFAKTIYEPPTTTNYKQSAVLALLFDRPAEQELEILLTVRSGELKNHSGQISFPGGRSDHNETIHETALRETREEVGIPGSNIVLLGELTPLYVPVSQSMIYPVLGFHKGAPTIAPNPAEVQEAFSIPLRELLDPSKIERQRWTVLGREVEVPFWNLRRQTPLWGATAMMTAELLALYEEFLDAPRAQRIFNFIGEQL